MGARRAAVMPVGPHGAATQSSLKVGMAKQLNRSRVLYVHLQFDGGIFVYRPNAEAVYISQSALKNDLATIKRLNGELQYSREFPEHDPPRHLSRTFELIKDFNIPIQLMEAHPQVYPRPERYIPPTVYASFHGELPWLRELVERGVDLDARDRFGQSGLMMAAHAGRIQAVKVLLDAKAPVNVVDNEGNTPIMFASQFGSDEMVRLLIAAGADVSAVQTNGLDALALAKKNGHHGVASLLQDHGASSRPWWRFW